MGRLIIIIIIIQDFHTELILFVICSVQVENWVKVHIMRQPKDELSCIDPIRYGERFQEFIEDLML